MLFRSPKKSKKTTKKLELSEKQKYEEKILKQEAELERLRVDPGDLDLLTIYKIVEEENPHIFQVHQNANAECPVGRNIVNAVFPFLDDAEKRLQHSLQHDTLADVIDRLKQLERSRNHEGSTTN